MSQPHGREHLYGPYGPPNGDHHDRHIQRIIDHANSLFTESSYSVPAAFASFTDYSDRDCLNTSVDPISHTGPEYNGLDDFDRTLLGHPQPTYHSSSMRSSFGNSGTNERISLPLNMGSDKPRRVLEDASHYFRPFMSRDPDHRSPFQDIPSFLNDGSSEMNRTSSTYGFHSSSPEYPYQPLARNPLAQVGTHYLPSTQQTPNQARMQRAEDTRPNRQLFAQPLLGSNMTPSINSSITSSSPLPAGNSSPSVRISREKKRPVLNRNYATPRQNQRPQLDLDHATYVPPIVNNTLLVDPRQSLPDKFRAIFPFELFNVVQSKCFPLVYTTNDNVVISAPTGSGKTAILEMAICKLVSTQRGANFKIVYQAPTKSLCSEKARDWQTKFSHMNLTCVELTGDTSQAEAHRIGSATIIVTTPEKWDSITRKWKDHRRLLELVRLVLIDEVHILKDTRGATLEAVVSRMKTIGANIRFVAISATVPNIRDVAVWLGRDHQNQLEPARYEVFGEEMRPVKLQRHVYGYDGAPNDFIFEKSLDGKLNLLIGKHSEGKPIMVFCFTRKSCERTAQCLAEWWSTCRNDDRPWPPPSRRVPVISQDLQELTRYGVAFHHAGLEASDRAAIEAGFLDGQLHLICCTSTLAVGINLPCHTVVLKGTNHYTNGGLQEYSDLEVMQMLGRAGRPQFDTRAVAIIMTRAANVQRYEKLVSDEELLESTLHQNLLEHLNSEIGLGTIQDIPTAKKWIGGTFLSVRVRQSPALYNLHNVQNAASADEQMEEWCERDVKLLQDNELVSKQLPLTCTEYGQAMSRYMIQFDTMKLLLSIPRAASTGEMLTIICQAVEFKDFKFKPAERTIFRELSKSPLVLHPIRETLTLTWHKIFMIVQIYLGGVELPTDKEVNFIRQDLLRERRMVFDRLKRLVRCVIDCKAFEGDGLGAQTALELNRSIEAQAWENKPVQLSQIPGFGPVAVRKWINSGARTVLDVADKDTLDIERIASRNPPYGRNVQKILEKFPRLTLKANIIESTGPRIESDEAITVTVRAHLWHCNKKAAPYWKDKIPALTFVVLTSDGNLAYFWRGSMKKLEGSEGLDIKFPVALTAPNQTICCHFSCENIVGTQVTVTLKPALPASAFQSIKKQTTQATTSKTERLHIEEDYDDISDEAMLEVFKSPRPCDSERIVQSLECLDNEEEDFPLIDELLAEDINFTGLPEANLGKMENGRYICNHACRNGGLTKSGKPCSHKCCREGVEKFRPRKASKSSGDLGSSHGHSTADRRDGGNANSGLSALTVGSQAVQSSHKFQVHPQVASKIKKRSLDGASTPRRAKISRLDSLSSLSNIEYVDLCDVSDSSTRSSPRKAPPLDKTRKQKQKLIHLHEKVKNAGATSPRLTKNHKTRLSSPSSDINQDYLGNNEKTPTATDANKIGTITRADRIRDEHDDEMPDLPDLPDLDELFSGKKGARLPELSENASPRMVLTSDETLYPGVVDSLKESMEYG
ncbi:hypothetical protein F5Y08DRAFT_355447 [Xylaria arbuscula]|nr:hypothetical protein F5Y08DRAFT_355447 [Xylaria arbuscula]